MTTDEELAPVLRGNTIKDDELLPPMLTAAASDEDAEAKLKLKPKLGVDAAVWTVVETAKDVSEVDVASAGQSVTVGAQLVKVSVAVEKMVSVMGPTALELDVTAELALTGKPP